jgi:hypothetical protein
MPVDNAWLRTTTPMPALQDVVTVTIVYEISPSFERTQAELREIIWFRALENGAGT